MLRIKKVWVFKFCQMDRQVMFVVGISVALFCLYNIRRYWVAFFTGAVVFDIIYFAISPDGLSGNLGDAGLGYISSILATGFGTYAVMFLIAVVIFNIFPSKAVKELRKNDELQKIIRHESSESKNNLAGPSDDKLKTDEGLTGVGKVQASSGYQEANNPKASDRKLKSKSTVNTDSKVIRLLIGSIIFVCIIILGFYTFKYFQNVKERNSISNEAGAKKARLERLATLVEWDTLDLSPVLGVKKASLRTKYIDGKMYYSFGISNDVGSRIPQKPNYSDRFFINLTDLDGFTMNSITVSISAMTRNFDKDGLFIYRTFEGQQQMSDSMYERFSNWTVSWKIKN